jgi:hypothetical protein
VPDIHPNENYAFEDGWKRWVKPWAVVDSEWVEGKNAYVNVNGEWTHIWESTPPVLDMGVQVSHVVNDGIYVNWTEHPYADGYTLVTPNGVTADVSSNSYRDRVPVPSVGKYTVTAYRVGDDGNSEGLLTSESETVSICQVPTSFTAVRNGTRVQLQWSDASVGFHDGFTVDAGSPISIPAGTTSYTHTSPTAGAVNSYKVKANIGSLSSAWTSSQSVSIEANVPTSVAIAATTTIGELKLTFAAPSSGSVTGYQVQANNGSWVAASSNSSGATYKFTGSGSKSMRVLAKSAGGNSAYVTKSATPLWTAKPNVPKSVSVAATSTVGQLKLTWSAPSADSTHSAATTYQVQTSTNNSSWTTVSGNKTSPYTHSFGSSGSGVRYMRVRATNTAGSSSYVSKSGTPLWPLPTPAAPSVSKFVPETSYGRMVLTFKTSGANNSQYRVAFKQGSGSWAYGSWTNVGNNTTKAVHVGTSANATQTVYAFVDCKNSTGQSSRSATANYAVSISPIVHRAKAAGHTRNGMYDSVSSLANQPAQGYHSSSNEYSGLWYYGTNVIHNSMKTQGTHCGAAREATSWNVGIWRENSSHGSASESPIYLGLHGWGEKPGSHTGTDGAVHVVHFCEHVASLGRGGGTYATFPPNIMSGLIDSPQYFQGLGVACNGYGNSYVKIFSHTQDPMETGRLAIWHLG